MRLAPVTRSDVGRRRSGARPALAAVAALAPVVALSSCSSGDAFEDRFEASTTNYGVSSMPLRAQGSPYSFNLGGHCSHDGPATLQSVRLHRPDEGIRLTAYATRVPTPPNGYGDELRTLEDAGVDVSRRDIEACEQGRSEVVVEVVRRSDDTVAARGFELVWSTEDGDEEHVYVPLGLALCAPSSLPTGCAGTGRLGSQVIDVVDRLS